jgi:hypothetical protein
MKKIDLGLPEKMELFHRSSHIEIVCKWFGWQIVFMTAFTLIWCGLIYNWYSKTIENSDSMQTYFYLISVAIGIGLTYYVIAGWLNRTHIIISHNKIAVYHRPIPWLGNKELDASNLKQLYTKRKISQSGNGTSVTYEVHAIMRNDRNIKLVRGLESSEQALYIEQEIEKYLGIEDLPVKGELGE